MIDDAIDVAEEAHSGQFRKGSDIPYISHPRAVARILSDAGCSVGDGCRGHSSRYG